MEKHLEHRIADEFQKKDADANYPRKEELWNRISNARNLKKRVHSFWRIAAVLLAVFFITGAFANFQVINAKLKQLAEAEKKTFKLQNTLDSLLNNTPGTITEIKYIEKEVKVFVPVEKDLATNKSENELLEKLKQENIQIKKQWKTETEIWQNKADSLLLELIALNKRTEINSGVTEKVETPASGVVELKPEKFEVPLQQMPKTENPKMKIRLFSNPGEKTNFDMNSTILKK